MEAEDRALLRTIARATRAGDETLTRVLDLAQQGLSAPISLLVDGRWIEGVLARPEDWADTLDDALDTGLGLTSDQLAREQGTVEDIAQIEPGTPTLGDVEHWRARLREASFRQQVDEGRQREQSVDDRVNALGDDEEPPEDLVDEVLLMQDPLRVITLTRVVVVGRVPAANRHLPTLRVLRSHVAAWRLGRSTTYDGGADT
ncbi:MAG: hypothetical protein ACLGI5_12440 [Thermoleophilia bacterium]